MTTTIISLVNQKLSEKIQSMISAEFRKSYKEWKKDGQENLRGEYILSICEQIEYNKKGCVSIPIEKDGVDGGYLEVYGIQQIPNTLSFGEIKQMENIKRCFEALKK